MWFVYDDPDENDPPASAVLRTKSGNDMKTGARSILLAGLVKPVGICEIRHTQNERPNLEKLESGTHLGHRLAREGGDELLGAPPKVILSTESRAHTPKRTTRDQILSR